MQFPFGPQVAVTLAKEELLVPGHMPRVADTALDFEDRSVKAYAAIPTKTVARIRPLAYLSYHFEKCSCCY